MKNEFIPVPTGKEYWYMDISNLSLEELINLRKQLLGEKNLGVRAIDRIIYAYTPYTDNFGDKNLSMDRKEMKRNTKREINMKKFGRGKRK